MPRRRAACLAALLVGGGLGAMAPTSPASATACAGFGSLTVNPGLFYPLGVPQVAITGGQATVLFHNTHRVAIWGFQIATGACTSGSAGGTGSLQGYCGHSTGAGFISGHLVQWMSLGGFMWFTNGVIGGALVEPNIFVGSNCVQTFLGSPGAWEFIMSSSVVLTNCSDTLDLLTTPASNGLTSQFVPLSFSILDPTPLNDWHVTFHIPHVHWSIHGCLLPSLL